MAGADSSHHASFLTSVKCVVVHLQGFIATGFFKGGVTLLLWSAIYRPPIAGAHLVRSGGGGGSFVPDATKDCSVSYNTCSFFELLTPPVPYFFPLLNCSHLPSPTTPPLVLLNFILFHYKNILNVTHTTINDYDEEEIYKAQLEAQSNSDTQ